jgi:sarcosine oxidase
VVTGPPREDREVAVVGGGLLGLATARALAARGRDVVLFEQATVGHTGGGSHGSARVFRLGYDNAEYVTMARRSLGLWRDLESGARQRLLVPAGQVSFAEDIGGLRDAMRAAGAPCEEMSAAEAAARFPGLAPDGPCLYEPESAVIAADRVLAVLAAGVPDLRAGRAVTELREDGGRVTVRAGADVVTARTAVVCAGPWTGALAAGAGIKVPGTATQELVAYVRPASATGSGGNGSSGNGSSGAGGWGAGEGPGGSVPPIFVRHGDRAPYGLPVPGSPLFKVGIHLGSPEGMRSRPAGEAAVRAEVVAAVRRYLPEYDPEPVSAETCVYDNSPDADFILDRRGAVVVGCGTSGHGFKFGPLFGEWLADLATGTEPAAMPAMFGLGRFRAG